jgi:hypothetical protein
MKSREERQMRTHVVREKGRMQLRAAVFVLITVALTIPQFAWADHMSGAPDWQASAESRGEYPRWRAWQSAPADDTDAGLAGVFARSFAGVLAREADEAAAGPDLEIAEVVAGSFAGIMAREADEDRTAVRSVGLLARSLSSSANAAAASAARWTAMGSYYAERAAAASLGRWVALGDFYSGGDGAFIAANPEAGVFERFIAGTGCSIGC